MIKFFVPYKTNEKPIGSEQAAGFPPFTRGYSCLSKNIQLINNIDTDYKINDYLDNTIIDLFKEIISNNVTDKKELKLSIPFNENAVSASYVIVIRTLLSFVIKKSTNNYVPVFTFYGNPENTNNELNTFILAKAAQIDYLVVDDLEKWTSIKLLCPEAPVDSLYGSEYLEKENEQIFLRLWKQIEKF